MLPPGAVPSARGLVDLLAPFRRVSATLIVTPRSVDSAHQSCSLLARRPSAGGLGNVLAPFRAAPVFVVCNAQMINGGRLIAPYASPEDGALDVCSVPDMGPIEFVALLRRVADG